MAKVIHVITGLSRGGAERTLYNILAGGLTATTDPIVLSLQGEGVYGDKIRSLGVPVYALETLSVLKAPQAFWWLQRLVRKVRPEIIHGWMYHGNLAASLAAQIAGRRKPIVAWNIRHSLYSLSAEKYLTQQVIRANCSISARVDAVVYNSHISREQHEQFGFAADKGQVIPNGFDTNRLRSDFERGQSTREALGISLHAVVIGHVARLHPMKDHASFLKAVVELMRRHADIVCLLVGRGVDLHNPAFAPIVPVELQGRFHFLGERSDVLDLMRVMDVFCLSSAWGEAFPNVLGEAMALGVPCVTTDVGDSSEIVGDTGEVVPPFNSNALTTGLSVMLQRSPEERISLGRLAQVRIADKYSLPSVVSHYRELYLRLQQETD